MGNKPSSRRVPVDESLTRPQGLYQHHDVDERKLRRLILDAKLAPCYQGAEEGANDLEECPICFLHYPSLNRSKCCGKGICTECFLQLKSSPASRPMQCPFCKEGTYAVEYRGALTTEEKGAEQAEEQLVIEARIRMQREEQRASDLRSSDSGESATAAAETRTTGVDEKDIGSPSRFEEPASGRSGDGTGGAWPLWRSARRGNSSSHARRGGISRGGIQPNQLAAPHNHHNHPHHSPPLSPPAFLGTGSGDFLQWVPRPEGEPPQLESPGDNFARYRVVPPSAVMSSGNDDLDVDLDEFLLMEAIIQSLQELANFQAHEDTAHGHAHPPEAARSDHGESVAIEADTNGANEQSSNEQNPPAVTEAAGHQAGLTGGTSGMPHHHRAQPGSWEGASPAPALQEGGLGDSRSEAEEARDLTDMEFNNQMDLAISLSLGEQ